MSQEMVINNSIPTPDLHPLGLQVMAQALAGDFDSALILAQKDGQLHIGLLKGTPFHNIGLAQTFLMYQQAFILSQINQPPEAGT